MESLLLPSKEMINPEIPLDEQTDALPYDVGWEFPFGNLKIGMLLGQGAFGRVLKAEALNIESGVAYTTVAVKTVRGWFVTYTPVTPYQRRPPKHCRPLAIDHLYLFPISYYVY